MVVLARLGFYQKFPSRLKWGSRNAMGDVGKDDRKESQEKFEKGKWNEFIYAIGSGSIPHKVFHLFPFHTI